MKQKTGRKEINAENATENKEAFLALLRAVQTGVEDEIPPGWDTSDGWAAKWGMSASHTRRLLCCAVKEKAVEAKKFRIRHTTYVRATVHYRQKVAQ
jgi:hypothetical protein